MVSMLDIGHLREVEPLVQLVGHGCGIPGLLCRTVASIVWVFNYPKPGLRLSRLTSIIHNDDAGVKCGRNSDNSRPNWSWA